MWSEHRVENQPIVSVVEILFLIPHSIPLAVYYTPLYPTKPQHSYPQVSPTTKRTALHKSVFVVFS